MSRTAALLVVLLTVLVPAAASQGTAEPQQPHLDQERLDRAIGEVLDQPEYRWRLGPRLRSDEEDDAESWLASLLDSVFASVVEGIESLRQWLARLGERWRRLFTPSQEQRSLSPEVGIATTWLLLALALALVCSLVVVLWLRSRRAKRAAAELQLEPLSLAELAEEESAADQVPPQRWRDWAVELAAGGKLREAVRAAHLAVLSELARCGMVRLERFKSNHDYLLELERRNRAAPQVPAWFNENVGVFEQVWYGRATASPELLQAILGNLDRIGSHVAAPA